MLGEESNLSVSCLSQEVVSVPTPCGHIPMPNSLITKSLEEANASCIDSLLQGGSHIYVADCDRISRLVQSPKQPFEVGVSFSLF